MVISDAVLTALISSIIGGFLVTFTNHLLTREKIKAETQKLQAEAEKMKAESARLLKGLDVQLESIVSIDKRLPFGWYKSGDYPNDYEMSIDRNVAHSGNASGYLKSRGIPRGFGTLMQTFKADVYCGKRLRMTAYVKAEQVKYWAGLWMRVDGKSKKSLSFDNMQRRQIKGTTGWRKHEIILDVPTNSYKIAFGILLSGEGQVWIDDISFEIVGNDVLTTDIQIQLPESPVNLNFETLHL